jgi:ring-1,2-phenylacetyl-CoA epoxidase subunit PaaC
MPYFGEMFIPSEAETWCIENGICPNLNEIRQNAYSKFEEVIKDATLTIPENNFNQLGGKTGLHTEKMGFILAEMQYLQRSHPGATW